MLRPHKNGKGLVCCDERVGAQHAAPAQGQCSTYAVATTVHFFPRFISCICPAWYTS